MILERRSRSSSIYSVLSWSRIKTNQDGSGFMCHTFDENSNTLVSTCRSLGLNSVLIFKSLGLDTVLDNAVNTRMTSTFVLIPLLLSFCSTILADHRAKYPRMSWLQLYKPVSTVGSLSEVRLFLVEPSLSEVCLYNLLCQMEAAIHTQ